MHLYRISGLTVASEIVLAGAWPLDAGEPDVFMRQGAVAPALSNPLTSTRHWDADDDHFLLRSPGVGRFLLSHGREITVEPEAGVPLANCAIYLQGTVLGMLLHQRGGLVLHASAVEVAGKAVLFCGPSGEGKSTLAAALSLRDHPVLSDDVSLVGFDDAGMPMVSADARQLKLADTAVEAMSLSRRRGEAVPGTTGKSYVSPPSRWGGASLPLGAIYLLRSRFEGGACTVTHLYAASALRELKRNAHRPGLLRRTGQSARFFRTTARILAHVGVFVIDRRRDLAQLAMTAIALEAHWREIGLDRRTSDNRQVRGDRQDAGAAER